MNGVMQDFERATHNPPPLAEFIDSCARYGVSPSEAVENYDKAMALELWLNDQYQVAIDKNPQHAFPGMTIWHLSIKRIDRAPLHDWRDLQEIKNKLCGENFEAVELYPAQARVVDTSNQYHLFAFMHDGQSPAPTFPVGWTAGLVLFPDRPDGSFKDNMAKQRPPKRRN